MIWILDQLAYKVANLVHAWLDIVAAEMRDIMASESDAQWMWKHSLKIP